MEGCYYMDLPTFSKCVSHFAFPSHFSHYLDLQPHIVVHQSTLPEKESTWTGQGFAHSHPISGWRGCQHSCTFELEKQPWGEAAACVLIYFLDKETCRTDYWPGIALGTVSRTNRPLLGSAGYWGVRQAGVEWEDKEMWRGAESVSSREKSIKKGPEERAWHVLRTEECPQWVNHRVSHGEWWEPVPGRGRSVSMGLPLLTCVTLGLVHGSASQTALWNRGGSTQEPRGPRGEGGGREWLWAPASASVRTAAFISISNVGDPVVLENRVPWIKKWLKATKSPLDLTSLDNRILCCSPWEKAIQVSRGVGVLSPKEWPIPYWKHTGLWCGQSWFWDFLFTFSQNFPKRSLKFPLSHLDWCLFPLAGQRNLPASLSPAFLRSKCVVMLSPLRLQPHKDTFIYMWKSVSPRRRTNIS